MTTSRITTALLLALLAPSARAAPFRPAAPRFPRRRGSDKPFTFVRVGRPAGLGKPVYLTSMPGAPDSILIVDQMGRLLATDKSHLGNVPRAILDITRLIGSRDNEEGFLGLAFPANFNTSRMLYVSYTRRQPSMGLVIAQYRWDAGRATIDPTTRREVFFVPRDAHQNTNHNGGMIAFGPDGMLYISTGDGGGGGDPDVNAQNKGLLLGKILRIKALDDGTVQIPPDNPFVNEPGARPEIYAYGLRNPWRFSFDRLNGQLWEGDVGQNAFEEINIIESGGNYGWPAREGKHPFVHPRHPAAPGAREPVHDYGRNQGGCVTGGYIYRGSNIPAARGLYFFADYSSRVVWTLDNRGGTSPVVTNLQSLDNISSFGEDAAGELYALGHGGVIYRLEPNVNPSNPVPTKLSDTGLFDDVPSLDPVEGLEEYAVASPLWSDGAEKRRWLGVPGTDQVNYSNFDSWNFPVGSVFVKHFAMNQAGRDHRLETRVLFRHEDGWAGYTYKWNATNTDADLLTTSLEEDIGGGQTWYYPGPTDCLTCHNGSRDYVLGVRTEQLERDFIGRMDAAALFTAPLPRREDWPLLANPLDPSVPLELRSRAYLSANCAVCHNANGPAPGGMDMQAHVPLAAMRLINVPPSQTDLGIPNALRIAVGSKERSVLWARMMRRDHQFQMPPLASNVVDAAGTNLLGQWIDAMTVPPLPR